MTREEFEKYLEKPELLDRNEATSLGLLLDDFPYFQIARLLYVKALKNKASFSFDEQLNKMAAYSPDRKALYYLIESIKEENVVEEVEELAEEGSLTADDQQEVVEMRKPFKLVVEESESDEDPLAKNYLHEMVTSQVPFELMEDAEVDETEKPNQTAEEDQKSEHRFTEWLSIFDGDGKHSPKATVAQSDLIDHFLSREIPKGRPAPKDDQPNVNLAKSSAQENEEIITETLAKIHVEQGNLARAVSIYEKLSLKYPEKSSYFAAQIKFLKQKK